jgi:hypothetical protein
MAETANEPASILADVERALGKGSQRGPAHRSTSMLFASGVLCFQTHKDQAVQRCCNLRNGILCEPFTPEDRQQFDEEYLRLYDLFMQEINDDSSSSETAKTAALAYRTAMPEPTNRATVKSFIACVLHAMSIDILDPDEGTKLLNGARIATLALVKRPKKKDKNQTSEAPAKEPATQSPESEIAAQKCA